MTIVLATVITVQLGGLDYLKCHCNYCTDGRPPLLLEATVTIVQLGGLPCHCSCCTDGRPIISYRFRGLIIVHAQCWVGPGRSHLAPCHWPQHWGLPVNNNSTQYSEDKVWIDHDFELRPADDVFWYKAFSSPYIERGDFSGGVGRLSSHLSAVI